MQTVFESGYNLFYDLAKRKFKKFKELGNFFVIRKVGKTLRLHLAFDDFVDWWDSEIDKETLESWLKNEIYTVAIFKWLPGDSKFLKTLSSLRISPRTILEGRVYYIDLREISDEERLLKSLSRNRRRDIKNMINRLNRGGEWKIERVSLEENWGNLVNFINSRFENSPFRDPDYSNTIKEFLKAVEHDFWALSLNGKGISYGIVLRFNKVAYWYLEGMDGNFAYYSPTKMLQYHMILEYQREGFWEFNFMKGESEYKAWWTDKFRKIYRYEYLNPSTFKRYLSAFVSLVNLV